LERILSGSEIDGKRLEAELRGTTLRVYWEVFSKNQPMGVREVQRILTLSSPSTALYHLEKLRRLGLVEKNPYGQYVLVEEVKVGTLRDFVRFGRLLLPRYLFYAAFFWTALVSYLLESQFADIRPDATALVLTACAAAATTYEAARAWRERLF